MSRPRSELLERRLLEKRYRKMAAAVGDRRTGFKHIEQPTRTQKAETGHEWASKLGRTSRAAPKIDALELGFREMAKHMPDQQMPPSQLMGITHASGEDTRSAGMTVTSEQHSQATHSSQRSTSTAAAASASSSAATTKTLTSTASIAANAASASAALAARTGLTQTKAGSNSNSKAVASSASRAAASASASASVAASSSSASPSGAAAAAAGKNAAAKPSRPPIGPGPPLGLSLSRTFSSVNLGPQRPRPQASASASTSFAGTSGATKSASSSSSSSSSESSYTPTPTFAEDGPRTTAAAAAASVAAARASKGSTDLKAMQESFAKIEQAYERDGHLPGGIGRNHEEALIRHWRKRGTVPLSSTSPESGGAKLSSRENRTSSTGSSSTEESGESGSEGGSDSEGSESSAETIARTNKVRRMAAAAARGEEPPSKRQRVAAASSSTESATSSSKMGEGQASPPQEMPLSTASHNDTLGPYNSVFPASWMGIHPVADLQRFGPAIVAAASSPRRPEEEDDNDDTANAPVAQPGPRDPTVSPYGRPGTTDEELMAFRASLPRPSPLWTYQTARQPAPKGRDPMDSDEDFMDDEDNEGEEEEDFDAGRGEVDPTLRELKRLAHALSERDRMRSGEGQRDEASGSSLPGSTSRQPTINLT